MFSIKSVPRVGTVRLLATRAAVSSACRLSNSSWLSLSPERKRVWRSVIFLRGFVWIEWSPPRAPPAQTRPIRRTRLPAAGSERIRRGFAPVW